jgi:hypothetical protein
MAKRAEAPIIYATLEGRPVVITSPKTGYWLIDGKWFRMHPADVTQTGGVSKADFDKSFPGLPPLPKRRDCIPPLPTDYRFHLPA